MHPSKIYDSQCSKKTFYYDNDDKLNQKTFMGVLINFTVFKTKIIQKKTLKFKFTIE